MQPSTALESNSFNCFSYIINFNTIKKSLPSFTWLIRLVKPAKLGSHHHKTMNKKAARVSCLIQVLRVLKSVLLVTHRNSNKISGECAK